MTDRIMVDIESLDTDPTAVILSIGAVRFNNGGIQARFYTTIDIQSCLDAGLTVSGKTIQWWMDQSEEARRVFSTMAVPLQEALEQFSQWLEKSEGLEVWANGSTFDIAALEHAFKKVGLPVPWPYYSVRDYRTFKSMYPKAVVDDLRVEPTTAHNALDDAEAQALTLGMLDSWRSYGHVTS